MKAFKIGIDSEYDIRDFVDTIEIVNGNIVDLLKKHKAGDVDAVISFKDTKHAYAYSNAILGLTGKKAYIVSEINLNQKLLIGDIGANVNMSSEDFVELADLMVKTHDNPKIGLINNGSERTKGDHRSMVYTLLDNIYGNKFIGNVEGDQILTTKATILLVDGFTGNVILKLLESTGDLNYKKVGAAQLLGVDGKVFIGHGKSDIETIMQACITVYNKFQYA